MEKAKRTINPNYFSVTGSEKIIMKDVTFKYSNSEEYIFENLRTIEPAN